MSAGKTAVVIGLAAAALAGGLATQSGASRPEGKDRWSGPAAIERLGDRLPAVAAEHGMSARELRRSLRDDATLHVDGTDRLLYVDMAAPEPAAAATDTAGASSIPDSQAFQLHSKPGAPRVIYLDFDGHVLSGTAWNDRTLGQCFADAFDTDNSPGSFSTADLGVVKSVWQRVAEDFAPFDVDVTTRDPGYQAINRSSSTDPNFGTRVVISRSVSTCPNGKNVYTAVCPNGCGGIAYVGSIDLAGSSHDYYQPAFIFQNGLGASAKMIAEAASHEAGHNMGLGHDGTVEVPYYLGHNDWAPIMGAAYYMPVTQWSRGEFTGAGNTEDDFSVAIANGITLRSDDHGNTTSAATALSAPAATAAGVIASAIDVDAFKVTAGAGPAVFTATPAAVSPNLDIRLELRDGRGRTVAVADPASSPITDDIQGGLDSTLSVTIPASGTYTLLVDGVGKGDPATNGYSDYGSVGSYTLTSTVTPATTTTNRRVDVSAISVSVSRSKTGVTATANVTVKDSTGAGVAKATVTGSWTVGGQNGAARSGTTSSSGVAAVSSGTLKVATGTPLSFCVSAVTLSGTTWDQALFAPATDCVSTTAP